ncbi:MAG: acetyl-CoA carboxylase biotin carboxyl carrier protein [Flavobacteriales bacterium Tduv]
MDLKDIKALIQFVSKSGVYEVDVKVGDTQVHIKNKVPVEQNSMFPSVEVLPELSQPATVFPAVEYPKEWRQEEEILESQYVTVRSPMIGTFYHRPAPDKEPYIKIGDKIEPGAKLCVIEAMKLFNDIEAEISGKIVKIFVEDASPVEYDQPLFLVDPS